MSYLPELPAPLRRISAVVRKELRQLIRDRLTAGFVIGVPIVQLTLFGYAINQDMRHARTAVVDQANSSISRQFVGELVATQTFDIVRYVATKDEARRLLQAGEVSVVVQIPPDFSRDFFRGSGMEVSFIVDATDPTLARAVRASANGLESRLNQIGRHFARTRESLGSEDIPEAAWRFSVLTLYNPELRTPVFVVPALLGVILTTTMILMTALSIVRERERGTFEFLIGTPVHRFELMIGKILPYVAIGFVQIVIVLATGLLLFSVPVRGSLVSLGVASLLFIGANLTLGLVISSVTMNQLQATQLSFFFFLPSVLLSGFMFPFNAMPAPAQWLGQLLPLTHYVRMTRGILLRGTGLGDLLPEAGALIAFLIVTLAMATRFFKKEVG
ncbi:MAG: ABC transporter permease [Acidobacteriota bacterium]|nr:ABC transporter permease [Acidobacteriota bacterium]